MTNPTQINLTILAPNRAVESPAQLLKPDRGDQPKFDHFLKQEVNQPHLDRTQRKKRPFSEPQAAERPEDPAPRSKTQTDAPVDPAPRSKTQTDAPVDPAPRSKTQTDTPVSDSNRPVNAAPSSRRTEPETRAAAAIDSGPRPPQAADSAAGKQAHGPLGTGKPPATAEEKLTQNLKDLNINPERIQLILDTIRKGPGAEEVMQALAGLLGALVNAEALTPSSPSGDKPQQTLAALLQKTANPADSAVQLNEQQKRIVDILVEAGLSRADAQKLLTVARQGNLSQNLEEIRIQLARATEKGVTQVADDPKPASPAAAVPKEHAAAAQVAPEKRPVDPSLNKLADLLSGRPQEPGILKGHASQGPAHPQPPAHPGLTRAADVSVPVVTPHSQTAAAATALRGNAEGGSTQPLAGVTETAARPAETAARPALPESYQPRGLFEKPVTQQIIEKFAIRTVGQQREIFIKLDPPSLGTVRMNVSTSGEHIKTTLVAENHFVKQAIENNLAQLKDALQGQGMKVDSFTVLVGGHPGQNAPHQRQDGQAPRFFGSQHGLGLQLEVPAETPAGRAPVFYYPSQSISVFA